MLISCHPRVTWPLTSRARPKLSSALLDMLLRAEIEELEIGMVCHISDG